jgi:DNA-binding MarR family transcriptional regulator
VLRVTRSGRRISAQLRRAQDETFATLLADWSAKDLASAAAGMERLARSLNAGSKPQGGR